MVGVKTFIKDLLFETLRALGISLQHNWKILFFAIVLAVMLKTYVNSEKLSQLYLRKRRFQY